MECPVGIDIDAYHLATVVDAGEPCHRGAGDVDGGEGAAAVPQEAMERAGGVQVLADDPAMVVDVRGLSWSRRRGHRSGSTHRRSNKKLRISFATCVSGDSLAVVADDLAALVDR